MLRVFIQLAPEPTPQTFTQTDPRTGERTVQRWHRARLLEVGYAETFEQAKKLASYPICEQVTDPVR